jgi:hypothetical protein
MLGPGPGTPWLPELLRAPLQLAAFLTSPRARWDVTKPRSAAALKLPTKITCI